MKTKELSVKPVLPIVLLAPNKKGEPLALPFYLCKDYKKDIFAVFAYDFEPSHNFQALEKSMFYASFPTIAPGLGGSDFTALLRAFGDREI